VTEIECAWLAGFLEGGTFRSERTRNGGRTAVVEIKSVDHDVIVKAARILGGYAVVRRTPDKTGHQEQYRVRVTGTAAIQIMQRVRPHMGARSAAKIAALVQTH